MHRGLASSGVMIGAFGVFLIFVDLLVPIGASVFGLPLAILGLLMFIVGLFATEPPPIEPAAGNKFCWYCMTEIPVEADECPYCRLKQPKP